MKTASGPIDRQVNALARGMSRRVDLLMNTYAPPGEVKPLHTALTKQETIDEIRKNPGGAVEQYIRTHIPLADQFKLDRAMTESIESDRLQAGRQLGG